MKIAHMKRWNKVALLAGVSVFLFSVVAPVMITSKVAYSVDNPPPVCGAKSCFQQASYSVDQICYVSLSYYFFELGASACTYQTVIRLQLGESTVDRVHLHDQ